jgi:sulfatase modifying factor 1
MHGNVSEWCRDGYGEGNSKESPADEPRGIDGASSRVRRGGSWDVVARNARSSHRRRIGTGDWLNFVGFRLARVQSVH